MEGVWHLDNIQIRETDSKYGTFCCLFSEATLQKDLKGQYMYSDIQCNL